MGPIQWKVLVNSGWSHYFGLADWALYPANDGKLECGWCPDTKGYSMPNLLHKTPLILERWTDYFIQRSENPLSSCLKKTTKQQFRKFGFIYMELCSALFTYFENKTVFMAFQSCKIHINGCCAGMAMWILITRK